VADLLARTVAQSASQTLGQTIVVENRPGGNQIIATSAVARSEPDGYTLLLADDVILTLNPHLFKKLSYAASDIVPVIDLAESRIVLSTNGASGKTLKEVLQHAKNHPGKLNYGTLGMGNTHHLLLEAIKQETNVDIVNVPYQGYAAAINDLLAGQVQLVSGGVGSPALGHIQNGKLQALAVSGNTRSALLPDTPTFSEAGYPNIQPSVSFIVYAPAGTPQALINQLHSGFDKALKQPNVVSTLAENGLEPLGRPSDQVSASLTEKAKSAAVTIERIGLRLD